MSLHTLPARLTAVLITGMLVSVLLLSLSACAGSSSTTAPQATSTHWAEVALTPLPAVAQSTTTPDASILEHKAIDYMLQHKPEDFDEPTQAGQLDGFWQDLGTVQGNDMRAYIVPVRGPVLGTVRWPIVIVSVDYQAFTRASILCNWRDGQWQFQELPYTTDFRVVSARQTVRNEQNELVIAYDTCGNCSASSVRFDLWRWDGLAWENHWQMPPPRGNPKLDGTLLFLQPYRNPATALDTIQITYSSWKQSDEKSRIFAESGSGPHRYFIETWEREGDSYRSASLRVKPSSYNTLLDLVFALRHNYQGRAQGWVVYPSLVERARALGLDKLPDGTIVQDGEGGHAEDSARWFISMSNSAKVEVRFTAAGDQWKIIGIQPLALASAAAPNDVSLPCSALVRASSFNSSWPTFEVPDFGIRLRYPPNLQLQTADAGGSAGPLRAITLENSRSSDSNAPQIPKITLTVWEAQGLTVQDWVSRHTTTLPFGGQVSLPDPRYFLWLGLKPEPVTVNSVPGLCFINSTNTISYHLVLPHRNWIVELAYDAFGPDYLGPAYSAILTSSEFTN